DRLRLLQCGGRPDRGEHHPQRGRGPQPGHRPPRLLIAALPIAALLIAILLIAILLIPAGDRAVNSPWCCSHPRDAAPPCSRPPSPPGSSRPRPGTYRG